MCGQDHGLKTEVGVWLHTMVLCEIKREAVKRCVSARKDGLYIKHGALKAALPAVRARCVVRGWTVAWCPLTGSGEFG